MKRYVFTVFSILLSFSLVACSSLSQEEVGGDLFLIKVEDLYSSNYDECLDRASEEKASNARPALATHVENMDEYDIIFLGFPN
nr:hypothetical protein [Traorella massiliensis]